MLRSLVFALLVTATVAACADRPASEEVGADTSAAAPAIAPGTSIYDMLLSDGRFSRLTSALDSAGLATTFQDNGPYTFFAPTNEAFATVPPDQAVMLQPAHLDSLRGVLLYHAVAGRAMTLRSRSLAPAPTLQGNPLPLRVSGDTVYVGTGRVLQADIPAGNGVIHVIDRVLFPQPDTTL